MPPSVTDEKQLRELLVNEFPTELLSLAFIYARNFQDYGFDITERLSTAVANQELIAKTRSKEHYDTVTHFFDGIDQEKLAQCIEVLKHEKECVVRNIKGCNRDCGNCDLLLSDATILEAYNNAITLLQCMVKN